MQQLKDIPWLVEELVNKKLVDKFINDPQPMAWKCNMCSSKWRESIKYRVNRNTKGCKSCNGFENKPSGLCISPGCKTKAVFGKNVALYCKTHKNDDDMDIRNRKCKSPGCTKQPKFGIDKVEYCLEHSNMECKNLVNVNCKYEGCTNRRISTTNEYCATHGPKDYQHRRVCETPNCNKACIFGFPGEKSARCIEHILPGMIDVKHKKCKNPNCDTRPSYNYENERIGIYCDEHKLPEMIDIVSNKCLYDNCKTQPSFNYMGETKRLYCKEHALSNMVNVINNKCDVENCFISASYGYSKEEGAKRCAVHKEDDMVDVIHKTCKYVGCRKNPVFNLPNSDKAIFCYEHCDKINMVNIVDKRCETHDCNTIVHFGYHGLGKTQCSRCKKPGMIKNPNRRCEVKYCQVLATHGIPDSYISPFENQAWRCHHHAQKEDVDVYAKECVKCGLKQTLDLENTCFFCNPKNNLQHLHREEIRVREYLIEHGITDGVYDKVIDSGVCGKERPDVLFDCGSYYTLLETDENQHDRASYGCEQTRMHNIWNMLALPTIFIRYNPHKYSPTVGGKRLPGENHGTRLEYLLKWIQYLKANKPQNNLSVVYLFYDGPYNNQILKLVE